MKLRQSLLWLGAPALMAAMMTQAAPGDQMPMQNQQMHQEKMQQMNQEQTQQMSNADMQKCAEIHGMDSTKMNMNDPHVQQMMQKCMQMMHEGKMMGSGMQGGQRQGGKMQSGNMMGGGTQGGNMQGGNMQGGMTGGQMMGDDN